MTDNKRLTNKIDFAMIIFVRRGANPNGDPLNGNRPRQTYDGYGEISDVCLKRKIRNRLQDMGESIFVQSDDNRAPGDEFRSLNDRFNAAKLVDTRKDACEKWFDVRAFGQVFAFKKKGEGKKGKDVDNSEENADAVSIGIRGPVTIQSALSIEPVVPDSLQIIKSVNLETNRENPDKKGPDTMGMKHRVGKGIYYVTYGAINTQLATKTGFSPADAKRIQAALRSLFVNDVSSARPEGSMEVVKVIWWPHNTPCGQYSSAKIHGVLRELLTERKDGTYDSNKLKQQLKGIEVQELDPLEGEELQKLCK